jgi:SAM-dependent methyltransferase
LFVSCIQDCLGGKSSYDVLSALFREMNQPGITPAGQFKGVDYFNGGLFSTVHPIELEREELKMLEVSALEDWSKVRPAIFGSIFESAIDQGERHAHGIHYTSEADIMKIVRPTISRYWEERINSAVNVAQLEALQLELQNYRVLDPACGSGNFLYIAYQELKQIEQLLLDKLAARRRSPREQIQMSFVTPNQFFGIDNNPFAVELARVTLMIARKVAIDRLGLYEPALPLDTLDQNIICQDALFTEWPKADAIIGNPPFLGGNRIRKELGNLYTDKLLESFPDVIDQVDFCAYWFRLTHSIMPEEGRAGLVATDRISQGRSRVAALDYITNNSGFIHEAVSSQQWSGEAQVKVSIVNWSRRNDQDSYLDNEKVICINSALRSTADLSSAARLSANMNLCLEGIKPSGKGFFIDEYLVSQWIAADSKNSVVLRKLCDASDLATSPNAIPTRWIVDFNDMSIEEASLYALPFGRIRQNVKPERDKNPRETRRLNWWKYGENSPKMRDSLSKIEYFFAVPRHSKYFMFLPLDSKILINDSTKAVISEDYFVLGVLTSNVHRVWTEAQSSTLGPSTRYTPRTCFETFPFPQSPTVECVEAIRNKAVELHKYRSDQMEQKQWGITTLYNAYFNEPASHLHKLHKQLDTLVMKAYTLEDGDGILDFLLDLNLKLADKEKRGEAIVGPWASTAG